MYVCEQYTYILLIEQYEKKHRYMYFLRLTFTHITSLYIPDPETSLRLLISSCCHSFKNKS